MIFIKILSHGRELFSLKTDIWLCKTDVPNTINICVPLACVVLSGDNKVELGHKMKHTALQEHTKSVNHVPCVQLWGHTSPMDAEDDGIQYFHSAYCSIPSSPSWPMSASLNHFLLFKVTAAKIHVKRLDRQMGHREVA